MTYSIFRSGGNVVAVFDDRTEALALLGYLAEEEPAQGDEFHLRTFDAGGRPVGEVLTASALLTGSAGLALGAAPAGLTGVGRREWSKGTSGPGGAA